MEQTVHRPVDRKAQPVAILKRIWLDQKCYKNEIKFKPTILVWHEHKHDTHVSATYIAMAYHDWFTIHANDDKSVVYLHM